MEEPIDRQIAFLKVVSEVVNRLKRRETVLGSDLNSAKLYAVRSRFPALVNYSISAKCSFLKTSESDAKSKRS